VVGAVWRGVGHLTTYGLIDSPTFYYPLLSSLVENVGHGGSFTAEVLDTK